MAPRPKEPFPSFTQMMVSDAAKKRGIKITLPPQLEVPRRRLVLKPLPQQARNKRRKAGLIIVSLGRGRGGAAFDVLLDFAGDADSDDESVATTGPRRSLWPSSIFKSVAQYLRQASDNMAR